MESDGEKFACTLVNFKHGWKTGGSEGFSWVFDLLSVVKKSLLISRMAAGGYIPDAKILGQFAEVCWRLIVLKVFFWFYMQGGLRNY